MTNPLIRISDLLDEVAEIFISKGFSENYATPVLYLLHELETRAIVIGSFSASDYENSLENVRDAIEKRLQQGRWS
jgi:hypothetical protein